MDLYYGGAMCPVVRSPKAFVPKDANNIDGRDCIFFQSEGLTQHSAWTRESVQSLHVPDDVFQSEGL